MTTEDEDKCKLRVVIEEVNLVLDVAFLHQSILLPKGNQWMQDSAPMPRTRLSEI